MLINAENLILGRLASFVAKKALLGESIEIINCEKAVIVGSKRDIIETYKERLNRTMPSSGPFVHRREDFFVRRAIRGMLTYKQGRGKDAFARIKCYLGIPDKFKNEKAETLREADVNVRGMVKFIFIKDLCMELGR